MKANKTVPLPDPLAPLRELIRRGRLFEVQHWIEAGSPIFIPGDRRRNALITAIDTGFHSMVEVVADAWSDQNSLVEALRLACYRHRPDLVEVLRLRGCTFQDVIFGVSRSRQPI